MSWIFIDDKIGHHPKCIQAGCSSWIWVCCIGYSKKFLTNGFVPDSAISTIAGGVANIKQHCVLLAKSGLLDRVKNGYLVHDFLDFNKSKTAIIKHWATLHEVRSKAGRVGGLHRAERAKQAKKTTKQTAKQTSSKLLDHASSKRQANRSSKTQAPIPVPIPTPIPTRKNKNKIQQPANLKQQASASQRANSSIRAVAKSPRPKISPKKKSAENIRVITKIAHEAIAKLGADSENLSEEIKTLCAKRHIAYDSGVVSSAIQSAAVQRRKRR